MARDRRGAQLAVELPPELLQRLRARAAADGRPVAALVRRWIEAGLSGDLEIAAAAPAGDLAERVQALEAAVAQLRGQPRASRRRPVRREPEPQLLALALPEPAGSAAIPLAGDEQIPHAGDAPAAAITTVELAQRTGTNKNGWNNWARDKRPGAVRKMPAGVGDWRLAGKAPAPGGGPDRWLWEPA